jgi:hypothetical protein
MAHDNARFLDQLRTIVGRRHVLRKAESMRRYRAAKRVAADGSTLREAALRSGKVSEEECDKMIVPKDMIGEGAAQPDVASPSRRLVTAFVRPEQGASQ